MKTWKEKKKRDRWKGISKWTEEQPKPSSAAQVLFGDTTLRRIKTSNGSYATKKKVLYSTKNIGGVMTLRPWESNFQAMKTFSEAHFTRSWSVTTALRSFTSPELKCKQNKSPLRRPISPGVEVLRPLFGISLHQSWNANKIKTSSEAHFARSWSVTTALRNFTSPKLKCKTK